MKVTIRVISWLTILAFASCHSPRREAMRMLSNARVLSVERPDSAIRIIDSVYRMDVYLSERTRMDMALMQAEAMFRDVSIDDYDIGDLLSSVSNSVELKYATSYFVNKKEPAKASRAALYNGFIQQFYGEKEDAVQSYKNAESYGTEAEEWEIVATSRFRMAKLSIDEGNASEALSFLKEALGGFDEEKYQERALCSNMMAVAYMLQGDYDEAEKCLMNSMELADAVGLSGSRKKFLNNYAVLYRQQGKYDQAINCIRLLMNDTVMANVAELAVNCLNMGKAFMAEGALDSAAFYFKRSESLALEGDVKKETLLSVYGSLRQLALKEGNYPLAYQYGDNHERVLYEVMLDLQNQSVYRIRQQYDYEVMRSTMNDMMERAKAIIAIIIILLIGVVAFFFYRMARKNKRMAEINADLFHFMKQNETLRHHVESNANTEMLKSQELADLFADRFVAMQKLDYFMHGKWEMRSLYEIEKILFKTKDHKTEIMHVLDMMYPNMRETVKMRYPEMTELECDVYMLSNFKLSRVEEATLLGVSTSVLDKTRGKVHKIMDQERN